MCIYKCVCVYIYKNICTHMFEVNDTVGIFGTWDHHVGNYEHPKLLTSPASFWASSAFAKSHCLTHYAGEFNYSRGLNNQPIPC